MPPAWFRGNGPAIDGNRDGVVAAPADDGQLCRSPEAEFLETPQDHLLRRRSSDRIINNGHERRGCHPAARFPTVPCQLIFLFLANLPTTARAEEAGHDAGLDDEVQPAAASFSPYRLLRFSTSIIAWSLHR